MRACLQIPHTKIKEKITEYRRKTLTNRIIWICHVCQKAEFYLGFSEYVFPSILPLN